MPYLERGAKTKLKLIEGAYQPWELKAMGFTSVFFETLNEGNLSDVLCQDVDDWENVPAPDFSQAGQKGI